MQVKTYLSLANPTCSSVFYLLKTRRLGMVSKSHLQPLGIHSQFHLHLRQWVSSNHYWLSNVLLHLGFQIAGLGHVWAGVWYYLCSDLLLDAVGNHTKHTGSGIPVLFKSWLHHSWLSDLVMCLLHLSNGNKIVSTSSCNYEDTWVHILKTLRRVPDMWNT